MPSRDPTRALGVVAVLAVLYAGLCKALLFHNLEYFGSDLFSFLEMTWSWHYSGRLLHDNIYGDNAAIHNLYLLPAFSPLTIPLGAYGLILGLVLLYLLAVMRVLSARALDLPGRLVILAGLLCPIAYYTFDHRNWGFHPELCYPPLALLLALDLLEGRRRAILAGLLVVLVKEDGAVLCASVLIAYFAERLWVTRHASREERRTVVTAAFLSLLAVCLAFALGMAALLAAGQPADGTQATAAPRLLDSLKILGDTFAGEEDERPRLRLQRGLAGYALVGCLVLLPLGKRLPRGLLLGLLASPPLVIILVISSGGYGFRHMLWPPRLATFLALAVACLVIAWRTALSLPRQPIASPVRSSVGGFRLATTLVAGVLVLVSWGLQVLLLAQVDYSPWPRLDARALLAERGYRLSMLPKDDVRFARCIAGRLPAGLPVYPPGGPHPLFHRQSIVFGGYEARSPRPPRLRLVPLSEARVGREGTPCLGPRSEGLQVEVECALLPLVAGCGGDGDAATVPAS